MVQITNTLVAAAIIVPAIAAPVIESREPKGGLRAIASIGRKVASGASFGLTAAPLLSGREEIEAREPRITSSQAKSFAKGVGALAHTTKSGIELAAAVAPLFPHNQRRSVDDSDLLEAREPRFGGGGHGRGRGHSGHAASFAGQERDFDDSQLLEAREPRFGGGGRGRGHFGHAASFAGQERDFDDSEFLEAREPRFGGGGRGRGHSGHAASFAGQERDFDDSELLDARDPKFSFGKILKGVGKVASLAIRDDETGEVYVRDFDDAELLDARDPKFSFGKILKGVGKAASLVIRDNETGEVYVRDFDDAELLDARRISSSALRHAGHAVAGAAGFAGTVAALNSQPREFDDAELDARDPFSFGKVFKKVAGLVIRDDEMGNIDAREPEPFGFGKILGGVAKVAKNFIRDDEMSDIDAREPEPFGFGKILGGVAKVAKNFIRDDETGEVYYVREASDIDELD